MITITTEKIEELRELAKDKFADFRMSIKPAEAFALLDLAQRAMVPQTQEGQLLCHVRYRCAQRWDGNGNNDPQVYEGYEVCEAHERGDDGSDAIPVFAPTASQQPQEGQELCPHDGKPACAECQGIGMCHATGEHLAAPQQPQGQALPLWKAEKSHDLARAYDENGDEIAGGYAKEVFAFVDAHNASIRAYASQLALPAGPVPEGELKEILGDLWDEGYVSPATYNDVDIRDPEERQRMRDHNVSEAQRRIAAALSAPASPAVAQPVADERAIRHAALEEAKEACLKGGLNFSANLITELQEAHSRAALCPPAEEGGKS